VNFAERWIEKLGLPIEEIQKLGFRIWGFYGSGDQPVMMVLWWWSDGDGRSMGGDWWWWVTRRSGD